MNWHIAQTDRDAGVVTLVNPALDWDSFPTLAEALLQEWGWWRSSGVRRRSSQLVAGFEGSLSARIRTLQRLLAGGGQPADAEVLLWLARQHQG